MNIYIFNYWVPFPSSEYGGMIVAVGNSTKEVEQMLLSDGSPFEWDAKHHKQRLKEAIDKSVIISTDQKFDGPQVISSFTT